MTKTKYLVQQFGGESDPKMVVLNALDPMTAACAAGKILYGDDFKRVLDQGDEVFIPMMTWNRYEDELIEDFESGNACGLKVSVLTENEAIDVIV
jgi:hypothetical protein